VTGASSLRHSGVTGKRPTHSLYTERPPRRIEAATSNCPSIQIAPMSTHASPH